MKLIKIFKTITQTLILITNSKLIKIKLSKKLTKIFLKEIEKYTK